VRAWIETENVLDVWSVRHVARRVRAWIETSSSIKLTLPILSPAVCGRGLKPCNFLSSSANAAVARRVRAWIETAVGIVRPAETAKSPAVCGRGLKL